LPARKASVLGYLAPVRRTSHPSRAPRHAVRLAVVPAHPCLPRVPHAIAHRAYATASMRAAPLAFVRHDTPEIGVTTLFPLSVT
jgi:hypothetical protein